MKVNMYVFIIMEEVHTHVLLYFKYTIYYNTYIHVHVKWCYHPPASESFCP